MSDIFASIYHCHMSKGTLTDYDRIERTRREVTAPIRYNGRFVMYINGMKIEKVQRGRPE